MVSFVGSYFYLVIFGEKAGAPNIDANLQRQINSQVQQIFIQATNTFIEPFIATWSAIIQLTQLMLQYWKYMLLFSILFGGSILMHYEHRDLMSGLDQLWRCFGHTAFYDFFVPLLQIIRLLYGFFIPVINLVLVSFYQLIQGSIVIFLKCSVNSIFIPIQYFVLGIADLVFAFVSWFGLDRLELSESNNVAVNDFNIEPGMTNLMISVNSTQIGMRCICESLDPVIDIFYAPITSHHLPRAIDHGWNTIIRMVQLFLRIVIPPGEIPNMERVLFHYYGTILESGFYLDHIVYTTFVNMVNIFSFDLINIDDLAIPKEFIFSTIARYYVSMVQFYAVWLKALPSLFSPEIASGSSAALMNAFNMDVYWSNLHIAIYDQFNCIHWFIYFVENIVGGIVTASNVNPGKLPTTFECNWVEDYVKGGWPHAPHMISYTVTCTFYNSALSTLGMWLVVSEFTKEIFFKSIVLQEQNVLRVMQKYDGMWTSRQELSSCEMRKQRATPINGTHRVDWTIDADACKCGMRLGEYVAPDPNNYPPPDGYRYASEPVYNPWCSQPTLQDQILAPMEASLIYATRGVFGPTGIGELLQYAEIWDLEELGASEEEIDTFIDYGHITRVVIEISRITVRLILSLPDIFDGKWVYYDINCGYGLNSTHLDFRYQKIMGIEYNSTSDQYEKNGQMVTLPTDDNTLRWSPCEKRKFRFPGLQYRKEDDMKICKDSNDNEACMCNFMLPLNMTMPCGCIAYLPEISEIADDNPITKFFAYNQMLKASYRWCNSNYLEWFLYMENQLYDSVAYILSFGPWNKDCTIPREVTADTSMDAYYVMAQLSTTDIENSDEIFQMEQACASGVGGVLASIAKDNPSLEAYTASKCDASGLLDATIAEARSRGSCKIWGNDNLFCSFGMIFRENRNLIINTQRQIHNNAIQFIGGNFNKFNLDIRYRLCDLEKYYGAMLSAATNMATFGQFRSLRKALGKLGIGLIEWYIMSPYKLGNNIIQFLLTYVDELKKTATGQSNNNALKQGIGNNVKQFVKNTIAIVLDIVLLATDGFGDVFDQFQQGAGDFFRDIGSVIKLLADALVGTFLDILGTLFDIIVEMIAFFSGKGSLETFLQKLFNFAFKLLGIIVTKLTLVLKAIFMMLGPTIGGFLNTLMSGFCSAINSVICTLTAGANCNIMTCISGGFGNPEGQPLGSAYHSKHGQDLPRLFAKHYHTVDGIPAPKWVAENIDWNGTSTCDLFVEGVRFYNYTEMRPLERAKWFECLELRAIGNEIERLIDIPELKLHDILYNYQRKWKISYELMQTLSVVSNIFLRDGTVYSSKIRRELNEINIPPNGPIKVYEKSLDLFNSFMKDVNMGDIADDLLKTFDPDYNAPDRPTHTARLYRAGSAIHKASSDAVSYWQEREVTKKGWKMFDTMYNIHKTEGMQQIFESKKTLLGLPHQIKTALQTIGHHVRNVKKKTFKRPYEFHTPHKLKKPLNTDIKFPDSKSVLCPNPASPTCVQCTILDNLFELVRDWSQAYGKFLTNVYATEYQAPDSTTGFVQPGTLNDIGMYFKHMFTNNSGFVDNTLNLARSKRRLHRQFNPLKQSSQEAYYNSSIAPMTQRWVSAGRDWEELWGNATGKLLGDDIPPAVLENNTKKLTRGVKRFLSAATDEYVPFFGLGIPYTVSYIFIESCDVKTSIWNEETSQSDRLIAIDYGLITCFIVTTALLLNGMWSVVPLGVVVNTIVLLHLNTLLFFFIVYSYIPSCMPAMPQMLMEDLLEWVQQRIAPGCFCESWPVLTEAWCNPSTCYQCDIAAGQYRNCLDDIPLADKWGVWWIIPMALRWLLPESIGWLAETGIIQEGDEYIQSVVFDAFSSPNGTTRLEKECVWVTGGDFFVNGVVLAMGGFIIMQVALSMVRLLVNIGLLLWQTFMLFQWTALAIEQSTRVSAEEDENTDELYSG